MVRAGWLLASILGAIAGLAASHAPAEPSRSEASSPGFPQTGQGHGQTIGYASCNAVACHGSLDQAALSKQQSPDTIWRVSGIIWLKLDPHAGAYDALASPLGQQISDRLKDNIDAAGKKIPATQDVRCLACHVNPSIADMQPENVQFHHEGVSCESCHGNAAKWEAAHTFSDDRRDRDKLWPGFRDLNNLATRANTCVGCHVGDKGGEDGPVRDMNHDMIAAGHPRLDRHLVWKDGKIIQDEAYFENLAKRVPKHWIERDRRTFVSGQFDAEASESSRQLLLTGLMKQAESTGRLTLLADRAHRAERHAARSPWPEFSESKCESCHFALSVPPVRGRAGIPPWSAPAGTNQALMDYLNDTASPNPTRILDLLNPARTR